LKTSNGSGQHRLQGTMGFQMKKIILATLLAGLGSTATLAADLGARSYSKAPATMAAVNNWSGFYVGGNVGYGWGDGNTSLSPLPSPATFNDLGLTTFNTKPAGVIGGAQVGYNWQMGSIVTGLEADFQGSGIKGSVPQTTFVDPSGHVPGEFAASSQKLSWFGTLRGRLGTTVTPGLLLYATGGLAYGQTEASANTHFVAPFDFPASVSQTKAGWTVGAGSEWMFPRNWSAKLEYLYIDLGNVSAVGNPTPALPPLQVSYLWHTRENIVRAGVNYHFN
jgi:outer membrane immunogenic protein